MRGWILGVAAVVAAAAVPGGTAFGAVTIRGLGVDGYAAGVNASGWVAGYHGVDVEPYGSENRAFLFDGAGARNIGSLGGTLTYAHAINGAGHVVGQSTTAGDAATRGFMYSGGAMVDIGDLGGGMAVAWAINDKGQVAGWSSTADGSQYAFVYDGGVMTSLGGLPGGNFRSRARGINNVGQVVGRAIVPANTAHEHAFLYTGGTMVDLGALPGGTASTATGINDAGQVIGYSNTSVRLNYRAFLYQDGAMKDLGTLGGAESYAEGINQAGQVVGYAKNASGSFRAFLYDGGQMVDLNTLLPAGSGWTLREAYGISDAGHVVGYGTNPGGNFEAFLMMVPEPAGAAWVVGVAAATAIGRAGRRDRRPWGVVGRR